MDKFFDNIKQFLQWQNIKTSGLVFRAHSSFTAAVLVTCSLLVTTTELIGSPIQCITKHKPAQVINTFCWIKSTYTVPDVGIEGPYPGISNDFGKETKYHNYYQWVCFALFGQALLCYLPKLMWDHFEGGLLFSLVQDLNQSLMNAEEREKKKRRIVQYLKQYMSLHNLYALRYLVCEFLCLLNILGQMFFMNWFLGGEFLTYGYQVLALSQKDQTERVDPMIYVFPRITKCDFYKFGPSGTIQRLDSLCILPLNVVNEKTYIFIWFWFLILLPLLTFVVLSRVLVLLSTRIRTNLLYSYSNAIPKEVCKVISEKVDFGDWWLLYFIKNNIDLLTFRDITFKFAKYINKHKHMGNGTKFEAKDTYLQTSSD